MTNLRSSVLVLFGVALLAACSPGAQDDTAAEEAAVRAVNAAWVQAFSTGDAAAAAALYADDAVLSAPGIPAVRGKEAIQQRLTHEMAMLKAAGMNIANDPGSDVAVSGDIAWETGGFTNADQTGAVVDTGKFTTVFTKRDGTWKIIRDTYNLNTQSPAGGSGNALRVVQFTAASADAQQAAMKLVDEEVDQVYGQAKGFQWVKYFLDPKTLETGSVSLWTSTADIDAFLQSEAYKPIPAKIQPLTRRGMTSKVYELHTSGK